MNAVWYRARALLRRQLGTTALLVALIALAGGVVLATVAGARQTGDALPTFLEHYHGQNVSAFVYFDALPSAETAALVDQIAAVPQWESVGVARPVLVSVPLDGDWVTQVAISLESGRYHVDWDRPIIVKGRLPDPEALDEVAVNESFADALGLEPGDEFPLRTVTPAALDAASAGLLTRDPNGEDVTMTVAGVIRRPVDLGAEHGTGSDGFGRDSWALETGPAFAEHYAGQLANYGVAVQGRARPGQVRALSNAIVDLGGPVEVQEGSEVREETASIQRAVDFERNALLLFALVAFITAAALIGQVLTRQVVIDLDDDDVLRAAGLRRRQRAAVPLPRAVGIAALGGVGAAVIAFAASGIFPVGLARRADLDPGVNVDATVLGIGLVLLFGAVLVCVVLAAWRGTAMTRSRAEGDGRPLRVSHATAMVARAGAPIPVVAGFRMALERGRGRNTVPVTGAILATTAGVVTLTALLVLAASIGRMVETPALQGWTWDTTVANLNDSEAVAEAIDALRANPRVASYIGFSSGPLAIDGQASYAGALGRGDLAAGPEVVDGRLPRDVDEVVLGRLTLADLDKEIGDRVELSPAPGVPGRSARIVGTAVLPAALDPALTLGRGALLTGAGASSVYGDPEFVPNTFLVRFTEGTTMTEGVRSLRTDFPETAGGVDRADDALNLARVQGLPRLLAVLVALLGLGTLGNTLATSVRRHRRDLATLSALGLGRRQLGTTVAWQATTFAMLALVMGIPVGVALGRTAWQLLMDSLGATATASVPFVALLGVAFGTVVMAVLIAALPARSAARTQPAEILHSE